jgi:hypothetical protein
MRKQERAGGREVSVLEKIAYFQNRRDEIPNQELAKELARTSSVKGIREIAASLSNENQNIRADCLKVLYEIGSLKPELIAEHAGSFLELLGDRNNRLVWGAMIALSTIAELKSSMIGRHAEEIMRVMEKGSVITVDNGVKTLALVASKELALRKKLVPFLFTHLQDCRAKKVPQHSENTLVAVDARNKARFIEVLSNRLPDLSPRQAQRVKKVIAQATTR